MLFGVDVAAGQMRPVAVAPVVARLRRGGLRGVALQPASDAVIIDSTDLTLDQVIERVEKIVEEKLGKSGVARM